MRKPKIGFPDLKGVPETFLKPYFVVLFYEPSQLPLAFFVGANDFLRNNNPRNASQAAIARRIRSRAFIVKTCSFERNRSTFCIARELKCYIVTGKSEV
jgi:hypothetical protein